MRRLFARRRTAVQPPAPPRARPRSTATVRELHLAYVADLTDEDLRSECEVARGVPVPNGCSETHVAPRAAG